jgi:uncharacterized repeat protein (TIGR01451 family)
VRRLKRKDEQLVNKRMHRKLRAGRIAAITAVVGALATLVAPAAVTASTVVDAFTPRFSATEPGSIALIGNTLMTCPPSQSCTDALSGNGGTANDNNDFSMVYVDVDGNANTFASSSADLNLPAGAEVLFAGLYWGAESSSNARDQVKFKMPGGSYETVSASEVVVDGSDYSGFADVTADVAGLNDPDGSYWVADVEGTTGVNQNAGWSLVVVYKDDGSPLRNMTVFDGYVAINTNNPSSVTTDVSGFLTPPSGSVTAEVGMVTFEGDLGLTGDQFLLNGTNVSDAANPVDNVFNSSIAKLGAPVGAKNPDFLNQLGFDIDRIDATGLIGNSETSASLSYTTEGDVYYPTVLTFAVDVFEPRLEVTKSLDDLNGARLKPGDTIEYTVQVDSTGTATATDLVLTDPIPAGTTYVPGSAKIVSGPNAGDVSDPSGDDVGEYDAGTDKLVLRLGTGATAGAGGSLDPGATTVVSFRVTVDNGVAPDTVIANQATVEYSGEGVVGTYTATSDSDPDTAGDQAAVISVEAPPDAADDTQATDEDTPVEVDVLANDSDPDGWADLDPASVHVTGGPSHGQISVNPANGVVTYTPAQDYNGADSFTYQVCDLSGQCSEALVDITVDPQPDPPDAQDDSAKTPAGTPVDVAVTANDSDPDGWADLDPASVQVTGGPSHGQVSVNPTDGVVTYTPDQTYKGLDTFTYQVCDMAGACDSATVTVGVAVDNMPPTAVDDSASTASGTPVDVDVLDNDDDPDGWTDLDPSSVQVTGGPSHGQVSVNPTDGVVTYTPDQGYSGPDSFTYQVCDWVGQCDTATVAVTVQAPSDAGPPDARNDVASTPSDTPVVINVLHNDLPGLGDLDPSTVAIVTPPGHGQADVDPVTGRISYTPNPGYHGRDSFWYQVCDTLGVCVTAKVRVNVILPDTATPFPASGPAGRSWRVVLLMALVPFVILAAGFVPLWRRRTQLRARNPR